MKVPCSPPSHATIRAAIAKVETGDWIDPEGYIGEYWIAYCLNAFTGERYGDGVAGTIEVACALAWIHAQSPDALIDGRVDPRISLDTSGYCFEAEWKTQSYSTVCCKRGG
jgi:hypothetical protein